MTEVIRRLVWFTFIACIIAYAVYLLLGSFVEARAYETPVVIRDELGPNTHQLSGMVMVPTSCHELTVRTQQYSENSFGLIFTTWEEPSVTCPDEEVPRSFHATLFAPAAGVSFSALLDGKPLSIAVYPDIPKLPKPTGQATTTQDSATQ